MPAGQGPRSGRRGQAGGLAWPRRWGTGGVGAESGPGARQWGRWTGRSGREGRTGTRRGVWGRWSVRGPGTRARRRPRALGARAARSRADGRGQGGAGGGGERIGGPGAGGPAGRRSVPRFRDRNGSAAGPKRPRGSRPALTSARGQGQGRGARSCSARSGACGGAEWADRDGPGGRGKPPERRARGGRSRGTLGDPAPPPPACALLHTEVRGGGAARPHPGAGRPRPPGPRPAGPAGSPGAARRGAAARSGVRFPHDSWPAGERAPALKRRPLRGGGRRGPGCALPTLAPRPEPEEAPAGVPRLPAPTPGTPHPPAGQPRQASLFLFLLAGVRTRPGSVPAARPAGWPALVLLGRSWEDSRAGGCSCPPAAGRAILGAAPTPNSSLPLCCPHWPELRIYPGGRLSSPSRLGTWLSGITHSFIHWVSSGPEVWG